MHHFVTTRRCSALTCLLFLAVHPVSAADVDEAGAHVSESPPLTWHENYAEAHAAAKRDGRMLLVNFVPHRSLEPAQAELDRLVRNDQTLRARLATMTLARLSEDAQVSDDGRQTRLLEHPAFRDLGGPGVALIDLRDPIASHYGRVVTVLPFAAGKYYRWQPSHLGVALDLPAGTISQRTMVWAVRVHHEAPASTLGEQHEELAHAAAEHAAYQAQIGVQGHHRWDERFPRIRAAVRALRASEVVAESWPGQTLIDACIDCVQSWRQSPGHWEAVRSRHRFFGYDICRGRNGIWYGTGIFAN
jgi:hypothetical protein